MFQLVAWLFARYDFGRLAVGLQPRFSTTFGFVILDGGTLTYWGLGYTIVAHKRLFLTEADGRQKGVRLVGPQIWYWIPLFNFPMPDDCLEIQ